MPKTQTVVSRKSGMVSSAIVLLVTIALSVAAGEFLIRLKNSSMTNYDIESWRYSKELKEPSPDPILDFDHQASKSAVLQNVEIRLNEMGLRGGPVLPLQAGTRRILV